MPMKMEKQTFLEISEIDPGSQWAACTGLMLGNVTSVDESKAGLPGAQNHRGITAGQTSSIDCRVCAHFEGASREGSVDISSKNIQQGIRHCRALQSKSEISATPEVKAGDLQGRDQPVLQREFETTLIELVRVYPKIKHGQNDELGMQISCETLS